MAEVKKQSKKSMAQPPVVCSQPNNNILYVIMGIIALFLVLVTIKVMSLEKKLTTMSAGTAPQVQKESSLSVPNLKKYAKEIGINTRKFNSCLDKNEKKAMVTADMNYGASVGIRGTPGFFINGKLLSGAFPFSLFKEIIDKEIAGTGSDNCLDYSENLQKYCSDPQNKSFDPVAKEINTTNTPSTGAKNGKVTIVEFSDFECPFCVRAYSTVKQILNEYKNEVRLYYKQFPLNNIHPNAQKAAEASLCAADQGKFWEYHDKIFELEAKKQIQ